jgi:hypothetical protein
LELDNLRKTDKEVSQESYSEADEISLIDLVAVLVRYRRMIIWGTVLVGVVVVVALCVFPAVGITGGDAPVYTVSMQVNVVTVPEEVNRYGSVDLLLTLRDVLLDPVYVLPHYQRMRSAAGDPMAEGQSRPERLLFLRDEYIGDEYEVSLDRAQSSVTISCTCENPELVSEFLRSLVANVDGPVQAEIADRIVPVSAVIEQALSTTLQSLASVILAGSQDLLGDQRSAGSGSVLDSLIRHLELNAPNSLQSLSQLVLAQEFFAVLSQSVSTFYSTTEETEVIAAPREGTGRSTRVMLSVIAAFFALVLIAFVRQYARNVSRDPLQMSKLREAWGFHESDESDDSDGTNAGN